MTSTAKRLPPHYRHPAARRVTPACSIFPPPNGCNLARCICVIISINESGLKNSWRHNPTSKKNPDFYMKLDHTTHAETGMLIRRPVSEVFEAFVNPEITTKFWFTDSTGQLEKGKVVEWTWKMYDFTGFVLVKELIAARSIEIEWG